MKLISKIKKWFRKAPPKSKPKKQAGIYFSVDDLQEMMSKQVFRGCNAGEGLFSSPPLSSKTGRDRSAGAGAHLGPVYDTLIEHIPSLKRMLKRAFAESKQDTALGYYSDEELEQILIERGGTKHYRGTWEEGVRQAVPTVLITKTPEYKRKTDGEYTNANVVIPNHRAVRA